MSDNFITDGAGAGASLMEPLKLLANAEKKNDQEVRQRHGPPHLKGRFAAKAH